LKNGIRNGYGVMLYANGDKYEGGFKEGAQDGWGMYVYANGGTLTGHFEMGRRTASEEKKVVAFFAGWAIIRPLLLVASLVINGVFVFRFCRLHVSHEDQERGRSELPIDER
jgi:hypothetical protein